MIRYLLLALIEWLEGYAPDWISKKPIQLLKGLIYFFAFLSLWLGYHVSV